MGKLTPPSIDVLGDFPFQCRTHLRGFTIMPFGMFQIKYGSFADLEVLVDPDTREIWVTQSTLRRLLNIDDKRTPELLRSKSLKSFAGKGFVSPKTKKAKDIKGVMRPCKVMPFEFARQVILWMAIEHKNPEAILSCPQVSLSHSLR